MTSLDELETPALLADLDKIERNIRRLQAYADEHGLRNRPHAKTHRLPFVAHLQYSAGAVGIACQKLSEAECMAAAGLSDIQITFPVVGVKKAERFAELAERTALSVAADSLAVAVPLSKALAKRGASAAFHVECDTGWRRTGVQTPAEAASLAVSISQLPGLEFAGLMTYPTSTKATPWLREARRLIEGRGLHVGVVSGGGTPGVFETHTVDEIQEIRAGTYVYGDRSTIHNGVTTLPDCALTILTTVVSRPTHDRAIIDGGTNTFTSAAPEGSDDGDGLYGLVVDAPSARLFLLEEEHGHIDVSACEEPPSVGDRLSIVPNSANGVTNLFDQIALHQNGTIVDVLPIAARGAQQ